MTDVPFLKERISELEQQLISLQKKYDTLMASTEKQLLALHEENDFLIKRNVKLEDEVMKLKMQYGAVISEDNGKTHTDIPDDLLLVGSKNYPNNEKHIIKPHSFGNLTAVHCSIYDFHIVASGGVDKEICIHDWKENKQLASIQLSGPILEIRFNPFLEKKNLILASCMDSKVFLLRLSEIEKKFSLEIIREYNDHHRQGAMRIRWSSTGDMFASASSDKTVHLYQVKQDGNEFVKLSTYYFNDSPCSMAFIPPSGDRKNELLIVAVRNDCYLHYVDCLSLEKTRLNMNVDGIEHVSYSILDLQVSPTSRFLLAATDKDRHFIVKVGTNQVLRTFYGHVSGAYSQPRVAWHFSEKYIMSNSESQGKIFIWCVASEKTETIIDAHSAAIRDLDYCISTNTLFTVSYDKTMKVWKN